MEIKIMREKIKDNMHGLGIPQDRIAKRLGQTRETILDHLLKMPVLAKLINSNLSRGFTVGSVLYISHEWHEWGANEKIKLDGSKV